MSKNFDKIIPYSDILIENDGGTINLDLTHNEAKRIIKKIKNYNFDKDVIKIEEESDKIINDLNYEENSFSFEILTTHQEKIFTKNLIKVLSLLKIDNFDYQNKNRENYKLYLDIQKQNNNDLLGRYYRIWILYLGQENTTLKIFFDNQGMFKSRFDLEEVIFKSYNLAYNNEIKKNNFNSIESTIRYIINVIVHKIKLNANFIQNKSIELSLYLLIVPVLFYYLIKISKIFNSILYNIFINFFNYFNKDEIGGLNKTHKKIILGSIAYFFTYYKFKELINKYISDSFDFNLASLIFTDKFDSSKKKEIINFYEQIEILEDIIQKFKNKKNIINIVDNISYSNKKEIEYYSKKIINICKDEIRKVNEYNIPCHTIIKKMITNNINLPVYFFIDKNCQFRSKIDCMCCLIYNVIKINQLNIFLTENFIIDGGCSNKKKTIKINKYLKKK